MLGGPFDPTAISAGIFTSLAYDILKHRSQSINNTLVGRVLRWAGIQEPNFEERLHDTLSKTLGVYFNEHPEYQLSDVEDFFRDPAVAQQLDDYILDRRPLDQNALQQLFNQHLRIAHIATRILFQRRGLSSQRLIDDFLQCYRRVLREQLSIPLLGILLDILEQNDMIIHELQASKEQPKQYIDTLLATKLSQASLQAAYQSGQQQLVAATTDLVKANQSVQVSSTRQQASPKLFTDGLCKGRLLRPTPDRYFVSHGFDPETLADWRQVIADSLSHIANASQPLQPYFSGDTLLGGFHLCSICERIYSTNFSIFLLPSSQDRNVYLELGVAIGLGIPFFLIQQYNATIPPILTSLTRYTKGGLFRSMRRELAGQVEEYDLGAVQFVKDVSNLPVQPQYLIVAGELIEDDDFEGYIIDAIEREYPQKLGALSLSTQLKKTRGLGIQQLIELIQTSRFAIYRVNEQCSPTTFLALGISISLNHPFLMIGKEREEVPLDLRGLNIYQFPSFTKLADEIVVWHRPFFEKHA